MLTIDCVMHIYYGFVVFTLYVGKTETAGRSQIRAFRTINAADSIRLAVKRVSAVLELWRLLSRGSDFRVYIDEWSSVWFSRYRLVRLILKFPMFGVDLWKRSPWMILNPLSSLLISFVLQNRFSVNEFMRTGRKILFGFCRTVNLHDCSLISRHYLWCSGHFFFHYYDKNEKNYLWRCRYVAHITNTSFVQYSASFLLLCFCSVYCCSKLGVYYRWTCAMQT